MKTRLLTILICSLMGSSSFAQISELLLAAKDGKPASYHGEIPNYRLKDEVDDILISTHNNGQVKCRIKVYDSKYPTCWFFDVDSLKGTLHNISLMVEDQTYYVDTATGTYTLSDDKQTETIKIIFHVDNRERNVSISWKVPTKQLEGKVYEALIREACSKTRDGGSMTYTYLILDFKSDTVEVYEYVQEANEIIGFADVPKSYKYTLSENIITIEGLRYFSTLNVLNTKLYGRESQTDPENYRKIFTLR